MNTKLQRLLLHIKNKTVLRRIGFEKTKRIKQFEAWKADPRLSKWRKIQKFNKSVILPVGKKAQIKLYTDNKLSELIYCQDFEKEELQFIQKYLHKGDTFIDIGANIGLHSVVGAEKIGTEGRVYAFEPSKATFKRLEENILLNNLENVKCINKAVSKNSESLILKRPTGGYDAWSSLGQPIAGQDWEEEVIESISLDSFLGSINNLEKLSLIKIDVEGWECFVIQGGTNHLSQVHSPNLLVEFNDQAACNAGKSCKQLYAEIQGMGYQLTAYEANINKVVPVALKALYPSTNLIATKCIQDTNLRLEAGAQI